MIMLWVYVINFNVLDLMLSNLADLWAFAYTTTDQLASAMSFMLLTAASLVLVAGAGSFLLLAAQNLRVRMKLPLHKARRRLMEYRNNG